MDVIPDGEPLGLVHDLLGRAHGRPLLHSSADVKPERRRRFPGGGRTEQPSSSQQPCVVRGDLEDERRAGGRRRPGLVGGGKGGSEAIMDCLNIRFTVSSPERTDCQTKFCHVKLCIQLLA